MAALELGAAPTRPGDTVTKSYVDGAISTSAATKVTTNGAITGATKTKITYDAKGLITAGADATTADIADSSNKRYVTDAYLTLLSNTSGTNTGDQDLSTYVTLTGTQTLTNKTLTSPKIDTSLLDANGNTILAVNPIGSAAVYLGIQNNTAGSVPRFYAGGSDTNIDVAFAAKGNGHFKLLDEDNDGEIDFDVSGSSANITLNLNTKGTGKIYHGGIEAVNLTATQTLTNKTLTSPVLTTPNIGTPSAGTLTNCTGLVATTGLTATGTKDSTTYLRGDNTWATPAGGGSSTWGAITGTLSSQTDLQAALDAKADDSDLTAYATKTGAETLTNKRITKRVYTYPTPLTFLQTVPALNADSYDVGLYDVTAAGASNIAAPTGTPVVGDKITYSFYVTSSNSFTPNWDTAFQGTSTTALPGNTSLTTSASQTVEFWWNGSKWRLVDAVIPTAAYRTGGTDVTVADGGTGRSTSTTAYGLIAAGTTATGAHQTISPGTSGQFLKSGGASALGAFATIAESDVTNLVTDLAAKAPLASPTFTGTVSGITAAMVSAVPTTRTVNTKALSADITLNQDEVLDGTTYKQYSATEKTKLAAITGTNTGDQDLSSYATKTGSETLTNKRINPRINSITSSATPTINSDTTDIFKITNPAASITAWTISGTPVDGQQLRIVMENQVATAWNITWTASVFEVGIGTQSNLLPAQMPLATAIAVDLIWNATTSRWRPALDMGATWYRSGGIDVPITDGGTGVSTLPSGLLKGAGTSAITAAAAGTDYVAPGGALGTPSSGTLTNVSGLVATTGLTATGTKDSTTYLRGDNTWATPAGGGPTAYSTTIGNASATQIDVTHSLASTATIVSVQRVSSGEFVYPDITTIDSNTTRFNFVAAPSSGEFRVTITGGTLTSSPAPGSITSTEMATGVTLNSPTLTNYTESVVANGTVTTSKTLSLASGTVQTATLTASTLCTFTMPTATAGKSFILYLKQAVTTGAGTATFSGVKWGSIGTPLQTTTAATMDIYSFVADGTNWYGSYMQGYTP